MDDQLHLLTGAYALNALDDEERRRFEHTLGFGDETAEEARELAETAALLAAGTTPVAPPPDLKARLMAQIAVTPQLDAVEEPRPAARDAGSAPADAGSPLRDAGSRPSVAGSRPYTPAPPPRRRWPTSASTAVVRCAFPSPPGGSLPRRLHSSWWPA
ncbi:hypothetical protein [Sinomonas atrocyanea]